MCFAKIPSAVRRKTSQFPGEFQQSENMHISKVFEILFPGICAQFNSNSYKSLKKKKKDTHISMAPDKHCQITFQLVALRDHIRSWLLPPRGFRAAPSFPTVTRCPGFGGRPISAPPTSCLAPAAQFWRYGQACVFWLSAAPVHVRLHVTQTDTATSASPPLSSRQGPRRIQSRPEPGE